MTLDSSYNNWSDLYFTQLFTTFGQLTAIFVSSSIAIPMLNYYSSFKSNKSCLAPTATYVSRKNYVDGDIKCNGDVLAVVYKKCYSNGSSKS